MVQRRPHHEYPRLGPTRLGHGTPVFTGGLLGQRLGCVHAGPLRHVAGFPTADYYGSSAPSRQRQPATDLPIRLGGTDGMVPTFTRQPFDGVGAQLCSCSIATATPQTFTVASRSATLSDKEFPESGMRCSAAVIHQVQAAGSLEELSAAGSSTYAFPSRCRTRAIWQY